MRVLILVLLSLSLSVPSFARKKAKTKNFTSLEQVTNNENLALSLDEEDFRHDLNQGPIKLSFLVDASSLMKSSIYPASFKTEIYVVNDDASKDLLTIYRPTLFSASKTQKLVFDLELTNLVKTSELEINLYDTNNSLNGVFKTNVEVENSSSSVLAELPEADCEGIFGECHLKYILKNIHFAAKRSKALNTTVEKNLDGSYLVSLPLSKSNKALKIINKINGNSQGSSNTGDLNFEFDGTNLFVVADDGTKTQVAAQGPQGEQGPVGPAGAQGPQGTTGFGVTGAAGTAGAVQFNTAGALAADSAQFFWDNTNKRLGIANNSPQAKLHADAINPGISLALFRNTNDNQELEINSITSEGIHLQAGTGDKMLLSTNDESDPDIAIAINGDVGIGIWDPSHKLDVNGEIQMTSMGPKLRFLDTDAGGSRPQIVVQNNDSFFFGGRDGFATQSFQFTSLFSNTRTNDAQIAIHGNTLTSGTSWGISMNLTHNGTEGIISTDYGDIVLDPISGNTEVDGDFTITNTGPEIIFNDTDGGTSRPRIINNDNDAIYVHGDDGFSEQRVIFMSTFSDTRTNDAIIRVQGDTQASGTSWGTYLGMTHNGTEGIINTDYGDMVLMPGAGTTNLGIGRTNPQRLLHVNDAMRLEPRASAPASPALGDIYVDSSEAVCVYVDSTWTKIAGAGSCT